jgi:riboflavin biosynthesis pyrimidine reductase
MPAELERRYGAFGLPLSVVYANFVSSLDGVVAIPGVARSSALISGGFDGDRFLVALLRSVADAVVIGAGTFREHQGPWTAETAFPELADEFAELRSRVTAAPVPQLIIVTSSGELDAPAAKLRDAIVVTTAKGASAVASGAGGARAIETFGNAEAVDVNDVVAWVRAHGHRRILTEGGPRLMGEMLTARAVAELFLTMSPILAGSGRAQERPVLSAGAELLPEAAIAGDIVSVRLASDYLFLRYSLSSRGGPAGGRSD